MLPSQHRQEYLGRAYLHAIAAQAGVICEDLFKDYGLDFTLRATRRIGQKGIAPDTWPVSVQLKSSTQVRKRNDELIYDLDRRAFDILTAPGRETRLLLLFWMASEESRWFRCTDGEGTFRYSVFWCRIEHKPIFKKKSVRIAIPLSQVLTPESLWHILEEARRRDERADSRGY